MPLPTLFWAALMAFLAVLMGAFGAHGLKSVLSAEMMTVYKTAVTYQMWHALGLGILAVLRMQDGESRLLRYSFYLMLLGIALFSGSLYVLTLFDLKALGIITPFGGTAFLIAWLLLMVYSVKKFK